MGSRSHILLALLCMGFAVKAELTITSTDFTETVFPWQPPVSAHRLDGPLRIVGCAGEYEPVTFTVFSQQPHAEVEVNVTELEAFGWEVFWVKSLHRESLGEASFINQLPNIPDAWKNESPELLMPFSEERPSLLPGFGQRIYLDCRIPDNQAPGVYRGHVTLSTGDVIPLAVEVLPFALAPAPSRYWMWRLTWSPIDKPENLACLQDIAAHGYSGLARKVGANFDITFQDGKLLVAPGAMPAFAKALRESGLAPQCADDGIAAQLLRVIAPHLELPLTDVAQQLPTLQDVLFQKLKRERQTIQAKQERLTDDVDAITLDEPVADPDADLRREAQRQADLLQKQIAALAIDGFRQVKEIADDLGLTLFVFPVDEPCGTPWRRLWTTYAAGLAQQAGLQTFSTRNNWDWDANLDYSAAGGMINSMYQEPTLMEAPYQGDLAFPSLPWIGGFRDGPQYHFQGLIDDVRFYNRALTADEVLRQHEQPAADPIAWFPCDGPMPNATLAGDPSFADGIIGRALELNGDDQHLIPRMPNTPIDFSRGWTISLWYKGNGCLFGLGYDLYQQDDKLRYTTTGEDKAWFTYGGHLSPRFWCHLTISFDPATHTIRAFCEDSELRRWHRQAIRWDYVQVRSFPPRNPRFKTGVMSWWYANHGALTNVTTFCYDWNASHLYVVYPKNGDRFRNEGVWYRTLGWEGCREGIDDARYLQTLVQAFQSERGMTHLQAVARVDALLAPVDGAYASISRVNETFGTYQTMRQHLIKEILKLQ